VTVSGQHYLYTNNFQGGFGGLHKNIEVLNKIFCNIYVVYCIPANSRWLQRIWGNFSCDRGNFTAFEVRKFKSNVQAIRINGQNRRVVGWIRREEAKAVIEAEDKRADVEFGHIKAGNGGLIQFFPEHLEVAKKYRSTTRLLRKE